MMIITPFTQELQELTVNVTDLTMLLGEYGCLSDCENDLSDDGQITSTDVSLFLQMFGTTCEY